MAADRSCPSFLDISGVTEPTRKASCCPEESVAMRSFHSRSPFCLGFPIRQQDPHPVDGRSLRAVHPLRSHSFPQSCEHRALRLCPPSAVTSTCRKKAKAEVFCPSAPATAAAFLVTSRAQGHTMECSHSSQELSQNTKPVHPIQNLTLPTRGNLVVTPSHTRQTGRKQIFLLLS